jgi:hypothetical protein
MSGCRILLGLLVTSLLNGCAISFSDFNQPLRTSRMHRPEVHAEPLHFQADIIIAHANTLSFENLYDSTTRTMTLSPLENSTFEDYSEPFRLSLVVLPQTELFYHTEGVGIKHQIQGQSADSATAGNRSVALTALVNYVSDKRNICADSLWGSGCSDPFLLDMTLLTVDVGVVWGYRIDDNLMLYGGPYLAHHTVEGDFTQTNTGTRYSYQGEGSEVGLSGAIEYQWQSGIGMTFETVFHHFKWDLSPSENTVFYGLSLFYRY